MNRREGGTVARGISRCIITNMNNEYERKIIELGCKEFL